MRDEQLVEALERDGRKSFVELAREFGVTEAAIRKRVKKLMENGVIRRFTVEVNPKKLGYGIISLIGVDTLPEKLISVISRLKDDERVRKLWSSAGDHMIMAELWLKDHRELESFVKELESVEGVTKVCPAILLERLK